VEHYVDKFSLPDVTEDDALAEMHEAEGVDMDAAQALEFLVGAGAELPPGTAGQATGELGRRTPPPTMGRPLSPDGTVTQGGSMVMVLVRRPSSRAAPAARRGGDLSSAEPW
jgi:hypothetical protein